MHFTLFNFNVLRYCSCAVVHLHHKNKPKKKTAMSKTIVISDDVINTINSLSEEDRITMSAAIAGELICGKSVEANLNSMQRIIYSIIRNSVKRSTAAYFNKIVATA